MAGPLSTRFENVPQGHDGTRGFAFELHFSEEVATTHLAIRDAVLEVSGGTVTGARRLADPSNREWEIEVEPAFDADVTVVLRANRPCLDDGAICTEDGERLSNGLETTVMGPGA